MEENGEKDDGCNDEANCMSRPRCTIGDVIDAAMKNNGREQKQECEGEVESMLQGRQCRSSQGLQES